MQRNRFVTATSLSFGLAALLGALSTGCAAAQRPQALDEASAMLSHRQVREVEGLKPKLVAEAKTYLRKASRAYDDGDLQEASLYAHMAINRFVTAQNLVKAASARRLAKITRGAQAGTMSEAERLRARQQELGRFQTLEQRIADIRAALDRKPEGDAPEVVNAKQALVKARRKQAEAIGAGAPVQAPQTYQQGASLIGTAVESLELGIYGESRQASAQALVAFERAIAEAKAPAPEAAPDPGAAERAAAEDALSDASSAQALALGAGAPQISAAAYQRATMLLGQAERRFDRQDYRGTLRLARDARDAFNASTAAPMVASAPAPMAATGSGHPTVEQILVALRFRRAEMLGQRKNEICGPTFKEFEAILELAGERYRAGDLTQAREFAIRAEERVRRCDDPGIQVSAAASVANAADDAKTALQKQRAATAIQRAQQELAKTRARLGADDRLAQPAQLIEHAEKWFDRSSYDRAEQLAGQAVLALTTIVATPKPAVAASTPVVDLVREEAALVIQKAQALHAEALIEGPDRADVKVAERHLEAAERWFDRGRYPQAKQDGSRAIELLAKLKTAAKVAPADKAPLGADGLRAQRAIEAAKDARVRAVVALVSDEALEVPDKLLTLAEAAFDKGKHEPAQLYAAKARAEYGKLTSPTTKTGEPKSGEPADDYLATCKDAGTKVSRAERLRDATQGKHLRKAEREQHERGGSLATVARVRLDKAECKDAGEMANEAIDILRTLPTKPTPTAKKPGTKKPGTKKPGTKKPGTKKPGTKKPGAPTPGEETSGEPWRAAYDKTMAALRKRKQAEGLLTSAMTDSWTRGNDALAKGRQSYKNKRYRDAETQSDVAIAQFEAVIAVGRGQPASALVSPKSPEATTPAGQPAPPTAAAPAPWEEPYKEVYRALRKQSEAREAAGTPEEKAAVERGGEHLALAKTAWAKKQHAAAAKHARAATIEFDGVLDGAKEPATEPGDTTADPVEAYRKADAALREAKVILQVCERDKCDERDFAELTRAREMISSAEENLANKQFSYAEQLASDAKDKLTTILAKERPQAPAPAQIDPEAKKRADDALREAEIAQQLCEARGCAKLELESWLRAQQNLASAKSAMADGDPERSARLADLASSAFKAIQAPTPATPTFQIPADITSVTRSGSQLYLNPAVDFRPGSSRLDRSSQGVIGDLAKVLTANAAVLEKVQILGYTDKSGNAGLNQTLSAQRARAVLDALAASGAPKALLSSEGRGQDNPVADNRTPEGRAANRRVEVHFVAK